MKIFLLRQCYSQIISLITILLTHASISYAQNIRYVDTTKSEGVGQDGTSWGKAYPTLKEATMERFHHDNNATQIQIYLYPNPLRTRLLKIAASGTDIPDITVFGLLGQKANVSILKSNESQTELDVSQLNVVVYLFKVRKSERVQVLRLVVNEY